LVLARIWRRGKQGDVLITGNRINVSPLQAFSIDAIRIMIHGGLLEFGGSRRMHGEEGHLSINSSRPAQILLQDLGRACASSEHNGTKWIAKLSALTIDVILLFLCVCINII